MTEKYEFTTYILFFRNVCQHMLQFIFYFSLNYKKSLHENMSYVYQFFLPSKFHLILKIV